MILRYTGITDDIGPAQKSESCPLTIGQSYEVAEIHEWPWHYMVREPGAEEWPTPKSDWFGIDPDEFEATDEPVPILRSGFAYVDRLSGFFGAVVDQREYVDRVARLQHLRHPHVGETFESWCASPLTDQWANVPGLANSRPLADEVARAYFEWLRFPADPFFGPAEVGAYEEVVEASEPLNAPFAFIGRADGHACCRRCYEARTAALKKCLERLLTSLGVEGVEVCSLNIGFWQRAEREDWLGGSADDEQPVGESEEAEGEEGVW